MTTTPAAEELPGIISVNDHIVEPRTLWQVRLDFVGGHYGFACYRLERFGIAA